MECKHEWHKINPFQSICCNCNAVVNVAQLKTMSQKEFAEQYTQNPECGPIIFDDLPYLSR
jgi:hypothetical protein